MIVAPCMALRLTRKLRSDEMIVFIGNVTRVAVVAIEELSLSPKDIV
jgi:hypothetical protein